MGLLGEGDGPGDLTDRFRSLLRAKGAESKLERITNQKTHIDAPVDLQGYLGAGLDSSDY